MNLKESRILVANDDGIHAEGIAVLEAIARELSDDVWVVAPESEQSGAGHSLTMHEPLRMRQIDERHFAVKGTPTDSVLVASMEIMKDKQPDLVLSGVNRGCNLAEDVTYSGTVAAAMEGTLLGIPSIAMSLGFITDAPVQWDTPRHFGADIVRQLTSVGWDDGNLINVNFPNIPVNQVQGIKVCPQGRRKIEEKLEKRHDPKGRPYFWIGGPGTEAYNDLPGADYTQVQKGFITITPLQLDLTNYKLLEEIREQFETTDERLTATV